MLYSHKVLEPLPIGPRRQERPRMSSSDPQDLKLRSQGLKQVRLNSKRALGTRVRCLSFADPGSAEGLHKEMAEHIQAFFFV